MLLKHKIGRKMNIEFVLAKKKDKEDTVSHQALGNLSVKLEINKYQQTRRPKNGSNGDTLVWWKKNATELPILLGVARPRLATPPTSASSERAFSASGLVIIDRRYNLDSGKVFKLVFIMQKYSTLENHVKKCPMEPESESECDIKHKSELSGPTLKEETPQIPTKMQQSKSNE